METMYDMTPDEMSEWIYCDYCGNSVEYYTTLDCDCYCSTCGYGVEDDCECTFCVTCHGNTEGDCVCD